MAIFWLFLRIVNNFFAFFFSFGVGTSLSLQMILYYNKF